MREILDFNSILGKVILELLERKDYTQAVKSVDQMTQSFSKEFSSLISTLSNHKKVHFKELN